MTTPKPFHTASVKVLSDVNGYAPELFRSEDAERFFRKNAGQSYQPSNGHEGELFMGLWCQRCTKDNLDDDTGLGGCDILCWTLAVCIGDPNYPPEWQYSKSGQPICTAFDPIATPDLSEGEGG